jgi:hypothetical protein
MGPSTFRNVAASAMEKRHLSSKKSETEKTTTLKISLPIEGSFVGTLDVFRNAHVSLRAPAFYLNSR